MVDVSSGWWQGGTLSGHSRPATMAVMVCGPTSVQVSCHAARPLTSVAWVGSPTRAHLPVTLSVTAAPPTGVAPARHAVTDLARRVGLAEEMIANVALAVSEAITNAVLHGYADRDTGYIEVAAHARGVEFVVTVTDDGNGMVPRPDSPGLGMGLPIIARLTQTMDVQSPDAAQ